MILDNLGGHFSIMFLNKSEYLNITKAGDDASIAITMGAWKSGSSTAWIGFPKQKVVIRSMDIQRNAKRRFEL